MAVAGQRLRLPRGAESREPAACSLPVLASILLGCPRPRTPFPSGSAHQDHVNQPAPTVHPGQTHASGGPSPRPRGLSSSSGTAGCQAPLHTALQGSELLQVAGAWGALRLDSPCEVLAVLVGCSGGYTEQDRRPRFYRNRLFRVTPHFAFIRKNESQPHTKIRLVIQ